MASRSPRRSALPSAIDIAVGRRLRDRRFELNLSHEELSALVGRSAAKIDAFETGRCRLGPGILLRFCHALEVKISYFYDFEILGAQEESAPVKQRPKSLETG